MSAVIIRVESQDSKKVMYWFDPGDDERSAFKDMCEQLEVTGFFYDRDDGPEATLRYGEESYKADFMYMDEPGIISRDGFESFM